MYTEMPRIFLKILLISGLIGEYYIANRLKSAEPFIDSYVPTETLTPPQKLFLDDYAVWEGG